ncbi:heparinase II/III domain-containing protein, partial [Nitratireductor sp. GCM10026969]|uniref:heparinase II/III domain-containing protein n=1 Tax=Nitratireductor sp. GCM10026969 TaxID=3252645 RepID=UPI003619C454
GPRNVACRRLDEAGMQGFVAGHDGYAARFGIVHERELVLSQEGALLAGTDRFRGAGGSQAKCNVAVRFHIHPDVELYRDDDGLLILAGEGMDTWVFSCGAVEPAVEETIFFAAVAGPCRSRQIVLYFAAEELAEVSWRLMRTHGSAARP